MELVKLAKPVPFVISGLASWRFLKDDGFRSESSIKQTFVQIVSSVPLCFHSVSSLTLPNNVLVEYGYDNASRLTSITYKQNGTTLLGNLTYEYDQNGNRITTGGSFARTGVPEAIANTNYNINNQQTVFGGKTLTYDNNGNVQTITEGGNTTTYFWNAPTNWSRSVGRVSTRRLRTTAWGDVSRRRSTEN